MTPTMKQADKIDFANLLTDNPDKVVIVTKCAMIIIIAHMESRLNGRDEVEFWEVIWGDPEDFNEALNWCRQRRDPHDPYHSNELWQRWE